MINDIYAQINAEIGKQVRGKAPLFSPQSSRHGTISCHGKWEVVSAVRMGYFITETTGDVLYVLYFPTDGTSKVEGSITLANGRTWVEVHFKTIYVGEFFLVGQEVIIMDAPKDE